MPRRFSFLVGSLVAITTLLLLLFFWSNVSPEAPAFQDSAPQSPIRVTLKPQVVSTDQISIDVTVSSTIEIPDLKFAVDTSPALKPTDLPQSSFHVLPNQPIHVTVRVTGAPGNKGEFVIVHAYGTMYTGTGGNGAGFWLDPQNGKWQILSDAEYYLRHPAPHESFSTPEPEPSPTPQSSLPLVAPSGTITVTGRWAYLDHAVTPTGIATT